MRAFASLLALVLGGCDDRSLETKALAEAPSRSWATAPLIPAFSAPTIASYDDKLVLVASDERWRSELALETWQFDGVRWQELHPRHAPPARQQPGLARFQDQLLLFGGRESSPTPELSGFLNETWTWNGVDWTQLQPAHSPLARSAPALSGWAGQVLLFGGQSGGGTGNDTWRWGGSHWTLQPVEGPTQCTSPAARHGATVVMFCAGQTFVWDGVRWTRKQPNTQPSARHGHVLASFGERVVMYGGYADSGNAQETWEWDGADWRERTVSPSPPMRIGYQLAQLGEKLVLHGGGESQTWTWDGERWSAATLPSMPTLRRDYAIAALGERVILFGGCCRPGTQRAQHWDDTWAWDGARWTELESSQRPAARAGSRLAAIGGTLVLFGGIGNDGLLADTWELDDNGWSQRHSETHPSARQRYALAAYAGKVLLFGGASSETPLADLWEWDGGSWRQLSFPAGPPAGSRYALARHGADLILFSGSFSELWSWNGSVWSRRELSEDAPPFSDPRVSLVETGSRLLAGGLSDFGFGFRTREWDGTRWSAESFVPHNMGAIASLGDSVVGLGGMPLRTWIYARR